MTQIEAVTFDAGSTLVHHSNRELRAATRSALKRLLRRRGIDRERYRSVVSSTARIWAGWTDAGTREAAERATDRLIGALGLRVSTSERVELQRLLGRFLQSSRYIPAPGVANALRRLQEEDVAIGVVSNRGLSTPGRLMVRELRRCGIAAFFTPGAMAWSDQIGFSKPDPRLFLASLRAVGVAPQRAAHVGDKKLKDVVGARRLGMRTVRYAGIKDDHSHGPEADVVIRHYDELSDALGICGRTAWTAVA